MVNLVHDEDLIRLALKLGCDFDVIEPLPLEMVDQVTPPLIDQIAVDRSFRINRNEFPLFALSQKRNNRETRTSCAHRNHGPDLNLEGDVDPIASGVILR